MKRIACCALAFAALIGAGLPASATAFCSVPPQNDGFLALRSGPSAQALLVARMKPGDEVMLGQRRSGRWQQVIYWEGESRHAPNGFARGRRGWVYAPLLGDECG